MMTTAPSAAGFGAFNDDAMDVHSDHEHELVDGDIDIDIGSATQSLQGEDDAISLQDAGTDGDAGDVDDDMVDKEDLIEEDEIGYDDLELEDAGNSSDHSPYTAQLGATEQPHVSHASTLPSVASNHDDVDEDLIDYSDDEEAQDEPGVEPAEPAETGGDASFASQTPHEVANPTDAAAESHAADEYPHEVDEHKAGVYQEHEQTTEPAWDHDNHDAAWEQPSASQYEEHGAEEPDGVLVHDDQQAKHAVETIAEEPSQPDSVSHDDANTSVEDRPSQQEDHSAASSHAKSDSSSSLLPVTIKYGASELWLIKTPDSGDDEWLLEDESVATQPLFNLFAACRKQLGDDLNNETEIGLHFDNFYGMEVFEESTACAYTTLKELVDIYASLHTQDGLTNPQPMYVTLKFRPRVSALLAELKEAVEAGIGFRGLQEAVESGHSNFSEMVKEEEDFGEYWEEDEHEHEHELEHDAGSEPGTQHEGSLVAEVNAETEESPPEKYASSGSHSPEHHGNEADAHSNFRGDVATHSTDADQEYSAENDGEKSKAVPDKASTPGPGSPVEEQAEAGLIELDFEDGEQEASHRSFHRSESTATVQGDEYAVPVDDTEHTLVNQNHDNEDGLHQEIDTGDQETFDPEEAHADSAGLDNEENVGEDDGEFIPAPENNEDNGEYADFEYGDADDQYYDDHEDVAGEPEEYEADTTEVQEGDHLSAADDDSRNVEFESFNEVEDYVEFAEEVNEFAEDDANAYPDDEGEFYFDEEEAEAAAAAARSSAAPADVAPSTSVDDSALSPQGQKRPLDEVDVGSDGAGGESDAKKPKL